MIQKVSKDHKSQDFYSKIYQEKWLHDDSIQIARYLTSRIGIFEEFNNKRVLDAGCGIGTFGKLLHETYGIEMYGLELNDTAVKKSIKNGVRTKLANLESTWPFKSNYFDAIISVQVIEHIVNPDIFFSQSYKVLKKDGLLIVTTPNLAAWFNRIIFLFGYQPFFLEVSTIDKTVGLSFTRRITQNKQPLGHVRGFTLHALKDISKLHGFHEVKSIGGEVNYLPSFMRPFDKLFSYFPSLATDLIFIARKI